MNGLSVAWTGATITSTIISTLILSLISALFLLWALKIFQVKGRNYWYAFFVTILFGVVNIILNALLMGNVNGTLMLILGIAISWALVCFLLNNKYKIGWVKATYVWLVWGILHYALSFLFIVLAAALAGVAAGLSGV